MLFNHVFIQISFNSEVCVRAKVAFDSPRSRDGNVRLPEVSPGVGHEGKGFGAEEASHNVALGSHERVLDPICNTNQRRKNVFGLFVPSPLRKISKTLFAN